MKRRNAETGKMRRPMKRNKITEGFYGSTLLYLKFLIVWGIVILADFILEFRFEFLWPFYLLLRSVYDSYKYQGLAFSIFFVCIALTSDMLCFFFVPVHLLFFAASTYVWVQYVWHTDRGICAPTVVLWVLFVYLEAAIRLRDVKHMPGHLDLCRPFAAHCIGYPVVTLGFGFKSYIGFRMRKRKQRDVAKENEFYMQLMQQALPVDTSKPPASLQAQQPPQQLPQQHEAVVAVSAASTANTTHSTAIVPAPNTIVQNTTKLTVSSGSKQQQQQQEKNGHIPNGTIANGLNHNSNHPHSHHGSSRSHSRRSVDKCSSGEHSDTRHTEKNIDRLRVNHSQSNGLAIGAGADEAMQTEPESRTSRRKEKKEQDKEREAAEYLQRLESEAKRLRTELQSSRASEQELRLQVASLTTSEKVSKGELSAMQREVEELQQSVQNALTSRNADKQSIASLERRIAEERRLRSHIESQLSQERKSRKQDEARAAQAAQVAAQQSSRGECTEQCKMRRRDLEKDLAECRVSKNWLDDRCAAIDRENSALVEQIRDTDILMSALSAMQEKNTHLENSLSAETRIKLDLFSALGEAKRQLELRENAIRNQEKEIDELKSKIAQVLAVMPTDTFNGPASSSAISRVRLAENPPGSTLDPNATAYTPKGSLVASTEA